MQDFAKLSNVFKCVCAVLQEEGFIFERTNKDIEKTSEYWAYLRHAYSNWDIRVIYKKIVSQLKQNGIEAEDSACGIEILRDLKSEIFILITNTVGSTGIVDCRFA